MTPIEQALRRLLAASAAKSERLLDRNVDIEFHAAMNEAKAALGIAQPETHQ